MDPPRPSLDARFVESLERALDADAHADPDAVDVARLQKILGLRTEALARRMFAAFDADGDGVLRRDELVAGIRKVVLGSTREKLGLAFRVHDEDGDGGIEPSELVKMIALALAEDDVTVGEADATRLAERVFAEADRNRDGRISFDELEQALTSRPALLEHMTRSDARWIAPNEDLVARLEARASRASGARLVELLQNRWVSILFVALWVAANALVFTKTMVATTRRPTPEILKLANAGAACLNLDVALILVPVLRRLLTRVRATWLGRVVPVDDATDFHRLVGYAIVFFGICHGTGHLAAYLEGTNPKLRSLASTEGLTGLGLLAAVAVMGLFARAAVRRSRRFELFYFTHLLYIAFFVLAIFHASSMLGWASLPLAGLVVERVARTRRRARTTSVVSAFALRSGVTRLELRRPAGFTHRAGDYVFLCVPAVARHEWHPFTLSSAPESDTLTVHVRSLGNWTAALRRLVESGGAAELVVQVDGAYGTPSGHIFDSRHAVLVGAGIGVTPFASVLESIVRRANGASDRPSKLEKVHFFWLNRDPYSFEWFNALLLDLERVDRAGLLDVQIWMTGGRGGITAAGLEVAREILHAAGERDVVTGLAAKTHMGHPDWETALRAIRDAHAPARVDLYFCGPHGLGQKLRPICARLGMTYREERF